MIDQKYFGTSSVFLSESTAQSQSSLPISIKLTPLKSSTKNPVLNLDKPSASWICKVFVSNSSKLNDVVVSRFAILSSNLPISFMVNLTLSSIIIFASSGW